MERTWGQGVFDLALPAAILLLSLMWFITTLRAGPPAMRQLNLQTCLLTIMAGAFWVLHW